MELGKVNRSSTASDDEEKKLGEEEDDQKLSSQDESKSKKKKLGGIKTMPFILGKSAPLLKSINLANTLSAHMLITFSFSFFLSRKTQSKGFPRKCCQLFQF